MTRMSPRKRPGTPPHRRNCEAFRPWSGAPGGRDYWLYGRHAALAALANPARHVHRIIMTRNTADELGSTIRQIAGRPRVEIVEREEIEELIPGGAPHQGITLRVSPLPAQAIDAVPRAEADRRRLVVVLDQVTDPRNMGAILRTAAVFGAVAVVTTERRSAPESGALAKAASGALDTLPMVRVPNLARALRTLKDYGYWVIALDHAAEERLETADLAPGLALVLGAEGHGLRSLTRDHCDKFVSIAVHPAAKAARIDSLNVASAAAIALHALAEVT